MATQTYEIGEGGVEWASAQLGEPVEAGKNYELEVDDDTPLVAAGWLIPSEKKKGDKD